MSEVQPVGTRMDRTAKAPLFIHGRGASPNRSLFPLRSAVKTRQGFCGSPAFTRNHDGTEVVPVSWR